MVVLVTFLGNDNISWTHDVEERLPFRVLYRREERRTAWVTPPEEPWQWGGGQATELSVNRKRSYLWPKCAWLCFNVGVGGRVEKDGIYSRA